VDRPNVVRPAECVIGHADTQTLKTSLVFLPVGPFVEIAPRPCLRSKTRHMRETFLLRSGFSTKKCRRIEKGSGQMVGQFGRGSV
jgi:hypothetical protein